MPEKGTRGKWFAFIQDTELHVVVVRGVVIQIRLLGIVVLTTNQTTRRCSTTNRTTQDCITSRWRTGCRSSPGHVVLLWRPILLGV